VISFDNVANNTVTNNEDFTISHYKELCQLAIKNYPIANFWNVPWGERFLLWRHDIDISLNRALVLAKEECQFGIRATYFLNPHSEFYNLAELNQNAIVKEIVSLGHDIGLHFDAGFFGQISEVELNDFVAREADYLSSLFKVQPVAFSFHNPIDATLKFEGDTYGGLLNTYSKRFKTEVQYCSDSNGYWRFRRLHDVLSDASDYCLQVLTHPGLWQDKPMPPRQRIFRSTIGRATSVMRSYDETLQQHGRLNQIGKAEALYVLRDSLPQCFQLCDYLWNQGEFQALFVELWRIHESQINRLCKAQLLNQWAFPEYEVNVFFSEDELIVDGWNFFQTVFEISLSKAIGANAIEYQSWQSLRNKVVHGLLTPEPAELESGCVAICEIICHLGQWGRVQHINYDGLADFEAIAFTTLKAAEEGLIENNYDLKDGSIDFSEKRLAILRGKLSKFKKHNL